MPTGLMSKSGAYRVTVVNEDGAPSGGVSSSRITSAAASTNATSAKTSAGTLFGIKGYNASGSLCYLKLYNKASAPTVGTDTPVLTLALLPNAGFVFDYPAGFYFSTGIAYALTTGVADNDTGAVAAGAVLALNIEYL